MFMHDDIVMPHFADMILVTFQFCLSQRSNNCVEIRIVVDFFIWLTKWYFAS